MEQTPFMKAMYAFARADPDDCLREWAAVLALVSNDETASDSSPKNSTSSLAPAVVSASSTERSTVSLHAPSSATSNPTTPDASRAVLDAQRDSSKDDLTPGARRIYDLLDGGSVAPTSSSAVPPGDHEPAAATSTTASPLDVLRAHSTSGAISMRAATATCVPRVIPLDSTPTLVPAGTAAPEWNFHSLMPSKCSTICPGSDASTTTSKLYQAAVQAPSASPKHHLMVDVDITTDICSMGCLDGAANSVEINNTNAMSPTLGNFSFTHVPMGESDSLCSGLCCDTDYSVCLLPWDPGEKLMVLRDSVFSRDIAWHVYVKKLDTDLSDSHDHDHKMGYANTYLHWFIHCGSETIQWEIAWALPCEYYFLVQPQIVWLQICILAWFEHLYEFIAMSCYYEPWNSWQIQFFVPGTRIASQIYALLNYLKARDGLEMRLELSMRTENFASNFCSIILHNMSTCSSLKILERTWFLASCIQPGTPLFLGSDGPLLQLYYTWFGSTTWSDQKKYRTDYCIGRIKVPSSGIGTIGNASICGSSYFQWYIAWSYTTAHAASLFATEALASDPSSVAVRLLAVWISDFVVDSALGSLSLHWGLALWNQPGVHFLLGGAAVHYSAWLFQLSIEFMQLVSTSSLQAVVLYWFANYHLQYDCELLQWLIAGSLATENACALVLVSYLASHVWVVLTPNGYVGRTTPYGTEQSEWKIAWPPLNQFMLNAYHTFSLGTPTEVGLLKDVLVQDWLICLNGHIIQCGFVVTQWKIAWSFFWEYYDFGDQSSLFIPAATLTYPVWYLSWDPGIWALLCFCGLFTQVVAKGGIMVEAPTYFYYHYSAVFLGQASSATTTSSTLCKSTSTTPATSVTVTTTARIMEESHVPWDPGGSTCHRLGVKPNFKEGGLSTTSLPGWLVGRHSWAKAGSEAHTRTKQMSIYTRRSTARRRGLERTERMASAGRRG